MNIDRILFFADGAEGEQSALARAIQIADHCDADIEVVDAVAEVASNDPSLDASVAALQESLVEDRQAVLDDMIGKTETGDRSIRSHMLVGKDYVEVIRLVQRENVDLVIKQANPKNAIQTVLFGSSDKRLLHQCPCPVLIMKPTHHKGIDSVLASVDPLPEDSNHIELNGRILDTAVFLAEMEKASLQVLHAWDLPVPDPTHRAHKDEFAELVGSLQADTEHRMDRLVSEYRKLEVEDHLVKGKPERVITDFVHRNNIDLLVMGTVSKSGIPGFFVGNTAENILDAVECSVLALKPQGWQSPIS